MEISLISWQNLSHFFTRCIYSWSLKFTVIYEHLCGRSLVSLLASSASCLRATIIRDAPARAECKVASRPMPRDQDDLPREILRVVMDLWVDERIAADNITDLTPFLEESQDPSSMWAQ